MERERKQNEMKEEKEKEGTSEERKEGKRREKNQSISSPPQELNVNVLKM